MNHHIYLRDCLTAALRLRGHDVECLDNAIEFIEHAALLEITLGTASYCGSSNSYVAHLRIQSTSEIEEFEGEDAAYDHSLLWHSSNFVGIRFRPYSDASPALALRLLDVDNIAQVVSEIVTKYGPLGLVDCIQYATGDEIQLVSGTESGVSMILEGRERGVNFSNDQRAFMLGSARAPKPYSVRDMWATPFTMIDADSPMGQHVQDLTRDMLIEEFRSIYSNAPIRHVGANVDEFDESEDVLDNLESFIGETFDLEFSASDLIATLGHQVVCSDPLNASQKEVAAIFGTKILSDLPLYVSAAFACFLGLSNNAYAAITESTSPDAEALRVCNLFLSLYEEPWATGSTEVREWIRIATADNARELASYYVSCIVNNVHIDGIDAQARTIMGRHIAANEELTNVFDESFWTESMNQLVSGPRFKMAIGEIKMHDIFAGTCPITATRNGADNTNWVLRKAEQTFAAHDVKQVVHMLNFAAAYVGRRKNDWADYSAELLRHMPLSIVAALALHNAVELNREPADSVEVHPLRTYMDKQMEVYLDYMERLLASQVPQYPVNGEYIDEMATLMRAGNVDVSGALYDMVTGSANHHNIDLLMRPLATYNDVTRRVKAHALVKSHDALNVLIDLPTAGMLTRMGNISALFKSARVPTSHDRVVEFIETKLALEFKGLHLLSSELRSLIWDTSARAVYFLTVVLALSDVDTLESFLEGSSKKARKDPTLRAVRRFLDSVRELISDSQETEPETETKPKAERKEPDPDGEVEASNRGRPFQARLPKSEVATFMTAKASSCKQARKLPAMNIARAVYAEFGHDVSVYGYNDCNSFCRAVADVVDDATVAEVLSNAAACAELSCDLEFDQLHSILRAVPLVVACSVYVADLLDVELESIDATNKNLKENDETTKSAIFISYVVNADFSELPFGDAQIVDDIVEVIGAEVWPWSEDGVADHSEPSPAPSCVDMDPADMEREDLIAYVNHFKLLSEEEVATTAESDLRQLVDDHQDELAAEEDEDE